MLKLLIADGSEEYRTALAEMVSGTYEVQICGEGGEALQLLRAFHPELMVLDLMLPGMDGISLLQIASEEKLLPKVLATTCFTNEYVVKAMQRMGTGYMMIKPCDLKASVARLADLAEMLGVPADQSENLIADILLSLGVPSKLRGSLYLRQAILESARQPGQMITKELYPAVGKRNDATVAQVERSIRSAIAAAWENREEAKWRQFFAPDKDGTLDRPTNAEFICCLADRLRSRQSQ